MKRLDYNGQVEPWKVDLIISRAKRMGFRCDEIEDAQQTIIFDVMCFRYNTTKSNGATETTALIALIDNRLKSLLRSKTRYQAHVDNFKCETELVYNPVFNLHCVVDVRIAVEALPPRERTVCRALGERYSIDEIARMLGCGWHTVKRLMRRVRNHFQKLGLDKLIHE